MKNEHSSSRREFVKKAAYVAPAILTLQAAPAYVKAGSIKESKKRPTKDTRKGFQPTRNSPQSFSLQSRKKG
jgi:hypothetical protein